MHTDPEHQVDWTAARTFLMEAVRKRWYHEESAVEELAQACLVRLLRASRRSQIDNVEALMNEIAKRVVIDELRGRTRRAAVFEPASDITMDQAQSVAPPPDHFGDPVARVRFIVLNFFGTTNCADLARDYFESLNWDQVAEKLGSSHAAVRKQWSRCVEKLRSAVSKDPSLAVLADWAGA